MYSKPYIVYIYVYIYSLDYHDLKVVSLKKTEGMSRAFGVVTGLDGM